MIKLLQLLLKAFPWLLSLGLLTWLFFQQLAEKSGPKREVIHNTLLTRIETIGKVELVKYNFQEVTEVKRISEVIDLKVFKFKTVPDSKAVLISEGTAVGCVDLKKVSGDMITQLNDTVYVHLPAPEICYFKIDLEKSRLYDLQVDYLSAENRKAFIQELYKAAEEEIKSSALQTGILDQTKENAHTILRPLFESIAEKPVILSFDMEASIEIE
ncbi:MAG: hypothetical protein Tsb0034_18460 [Ekhidna sp.]